MALKISSNIIGDSNDENNVLHKLLLTSTQVSKFCKAFANNSSTAISCGSLLRKNIEKNTCVVMIRIIITFENQVFLHKALPSSKLYWTLSYFRLYNYCMCFHFCFCFFNWYSNRNYKFCNWMKNLCINCAIKKYKSII